MNILYCEATKEDIMEYINEYGITCNIDNVAGSRYQKRTSGIALSPVYGRSCII